MTNTLYWHYSPDFRRRTWLGVFTCEGFQMARRNEIGRPISRCVRQTPCKITRRCPSEPMWEYRRKISGTFAASKGLLYQGTSPRLKCSCCRGCVGRGQSPAASSVCENSVPIQFKQLYKPHVSRAEPQIQLLSRCSSEIFSSSYLCSFIGTSVIVLLLQPLVRGPGLLRILSSFLKLSRGGGTAD